jgi:hypothetical protein
VWSVDGPTTSPGLSKVVISPSCGVISRGDRAVNVQIRFGRPLMEPRPALLLPAAGPTSHRGRVYTPESFIFCNTTNKVVLDLRLDNDRYTYIYNMRDSAEVNSSTNTDCQDFIGHKGTASDVSTWSREERICSLLKSATACQTITTN